MTVLFKIPTEAEALNLFIHDEGVEILGLPINYWKDQPVFFDFKSDGTISFEMQQEREVSSDTQHCDEVSEKGYSKVF